MSRHAEKSGQLNFGFSSLNRWDRPRVGPVFDPLTNDPTSNVERQCISGLTPNAGTSGARMLAICVDVKVPTQAGPANTWVSRMCRDTREIPKPLLAVRARIVEYEAMCKPVWGMSPEGKAFYKPERARLYPVFIAANETISKDIPSPGDIIEVDFGNRDQRTDPKYFGKVHENSIGMALFRTGISTFNAHAGETRLYSRPPPGKNDPRGITWVDTNEMKTAHSNNCASPVSTTDNPNTVPLFPASGIMFNAGKGVGSYKAVAWRWKGNVMRLGAAAAWDAMVNAAKRNQVTLSGACYRSRENQVNKRCLFERGDGNPANKPGDSNHQKGIAVDVHNIKTISGDISKGFGQPYDWLVANAKDYGFKVISNEAWHWEWTATQKYPDRQ